MTKYKNIAQFNLGVERVTENLSQGERLALYCLATNGDYRTAESHPGNGELMRVTGCKTRQGVNFIINKLIARKLIRKVSDGDGGRGLATIYRILIEDSRFPEPGKKPASNGKPASDNPASSDNGNLQVAQPKPASTVAENPQATTCTPPPGLSGTSHLPLHPQEPSGPNPGPLAEKNGGGGGTSSSSQDPSKRVAKAIEKWAEQMGTPSPGEKAKLLQLARDVEFWHALKTFVADKLASTLGFAGLARPWALFIKVFDDMKAKYARDAQRETDKQKDYAAAIARDTEECRRISPDLNAKKRGVDFDEAFAAVSEKPDSPVT